MTKHDKNSSQVKSKTCPKTTAYHSGSCHSFSLLFALAPTSQLRNHDTSYVFESPVFLVNLEASYPTYSPENCLYKGSSNFMEQSWFKQNASLIKIPKSLLSDLRILDCVIDKAIREHPVSPSPDNHVPQSVSGKPLIRWGFTRPRC